MDIFDSRRVSNRNTVGCVWFVLWPTTAPADPRFCLSPVSLFHNLSSVIRLRSPTFSAAAA